ncbi:MAG: hypothetical protein AAFY99_03735 [Pseudomonadota bacterium]
MGGYGSGGWNATGRPTTAEVPRIDVNCLNKAGALRRGFKGTLSWPLDDGGHEAVPIDTQSNRIFFLTSGPRLALAEEVAITWEPCRFGGQRPFFVCPNCGERTLHLYHHGHFACRKCHALSYPSQRERESDRAQRRANKIRIRMGGEPGWHRVPDRPKGMHQSTYGKLIKKITDADRITDCYAAGRFNL